MLTIIMKNAFFSASVVRPRDTFPRLVQLKTNLH